MTDPPEVLGFLACHDKLPLCLPINAVAAIPTIQEVTSSSAVTALLVQLGHHAFVALEPSVRDRDRGLPPLSNSEGRHTGRLEAILENEAKGGCIENPFFGVDPEKLLKLLGTFLFAEHLEEETTKRAEDVSA